MLNNLKKKGLKYNIENKFFGQTEIDYLGFWVTRNGVRLRNKKIEVITNMVPTTYQKELQQVIGVIYYYPNMWPRLSHMLELLTKLTYINRKFKWTEVNQDAFDEIKRIMTCGNLLTYPDFNESFIIHTNASVFRLGALIIQKGRPITFYSIKLTDDQQRYIITLRELLSIVETLKELRTILLSQKYEYILIIRTLCINCLISIEY